MFEPNKYTLKPQDGEREVLHVSYHREPGHSYSELSQEHREPGQGHRQLSQRFLEFEEAESTYLPDANVGKRVEWPSLSDRDEEIYFKEQQVSRPTREKQFNRRLCEEEVRAEKAATNRHRRSGYLGELRKRSSRLRELIYDPEASETDIQHEYTAYDRAFHNFMDAHENCMEDTCSEEQRLLMIDSYENQRDLKLQLDNLFSQTVKSKKPSKPLSESGFSHRSSHSSRSSVREKKRLEEAKLNIETLKKKQEIQRRLEEIEKGKAELSREIELLEAETSYKQAAIDLAMEQYVENESMRKESTNEDVMPSCRDGTDVFNSNIPCYTIPSATYTATTSQPCQVSTSSGTLSNEHLKKTQFDTVPPTLSDGGFHTNDAFLKPSSSQQPATPHNTVTNNPVTVHPKVTPAVSKVPCFTTNHLQSTPIVSTMPSDSTRLLLDPATSTFQPISSRPLQPTFTSRVSTTPYTYGDGAVPKVPAQREFRPVSSYPLQSTPYNQPSLQENSQLDAWSTIAQAIKQGPTLPKIELMKFSGDPLEYAEFVTNFKDNIETQVTEDSQRLTRLLAQCTGKAKEAIRSCVNLPYGTRYKDAWRTLLENFGQPHMIAEAHMKKLKEIQIRKGDAASLMDFARKLEDARRVLCNMGPNYSCRLDNEDTIVALMRKLPEESLKRRWADKAGDLIKTKGRAEYQDFVDFVRKTANRINNRYGQELKTSLPVNPKNERQLQDQRFKITTLAAQGDIVQRGSSREVPSTPRKCPQCSGPHGIWRCWKFKGSTMNERLKVVKQHNLCRSCLGEGHFSKSCTKGFTCRIDGCGENHHLLLHPSVKESKANEASRESKNTASSRNQVEAQTSSKVSSSATTTKPKHPVAIGTPSRPRVCFKVVPVKVSSQDSDKMITTYAFFDSGSDASLCLGSLIEELDVKNPEPTTYTLSTLNQREERSGYAVNLTIESLSGDAKFSLENVLTTQSLPVQPKHVASSEEITKWPHLSDLTLPDTENKTVTILIGNDRPDIIDSELERRVGNKGEPFAVKTPFGWTVYGPIEESTKNNVHVNLTSAEHKDLDKKLELMYDGEFEDVHDETQGMSTEDRKANKIMDLSATMVNGHYQVKLPFREDPPNLPDSRPIAEKRLDYLKKKMEKDPPFKEKYVSVVEKYKTEGSSKEVPQEEVAKLKPIWYLPHHAVWHPRKPDEPRVVFDCAAKSRGVSLNDQLLRGPENTSSLIGVILRFRVNDVAVAADVKRMFHQVYVAPEDCGALCYLWWPDGDVTKEPRTNQMLVHIFGATSSPSVAGYALRKTAKDNQDKFSPDAVDAVLRDFYVDDLLKSFADAEQAIDVSKELQELLARGGFQLTKWISNDRDVLSAFPEDERAPTIKNLDLKTENLPLDRALGIHWDVEEDTFNLVVSAREHPENRKGVLSSIATVYDPLGFASPLILIGREINQELCKMKYDWNDALPKDLLARWKDWKDGLANIRDFKLPRCYKPKDFGEVTSAEIHHFADASQEHGYGTASYLRITNDREEIHCSFIMGKSRVKPLKSTMTVPKLELTAATLLIRMNDLISKELQGRLQIDDTTYWTDSMIVLGYINNDAKRFPTFVANRVAVIRQGSEPSQWKHVRSELNPADHASRGIRACETEKLEHWTRGPEFLWKNKEEWPVQPTEIKEDTDTDTEEITAVGTTVMQEDFWNSMFNRYSSWDRLRRVVAWLIRTVRNLQDLRMHHEDEKEQLARKPTLTVAEVKEAEERIVKQVQRQSFSSDDGKEEVTLNAESTTKLNRLKPFVEGGSVRVGGRLSRSYLDFDAKHPLILPGRHPVTNLIILHYHEQNGHVGTHQVLAEIRQRFWIIGGASSVKRVLSKCHVCRRQNAKMGEQITAPLPAVRVSSDEHQLIYPFAAVGLDYFGPLYVKTGPETRASKRNPTLSKRYGCIFTCLRYRAVHIEVAQDLSTDSFINAVLRFVSRRGPPRVIYSDNGSNFKGAELDVIKALKAWNQEEIQSKLNQRGIEWNFNPPAASHQGGVWERLIRSVRRILHSMIGERLLNDESLRTFLTEVEKILNDRPITRVSSDARDLEALTPSHILLLRRNAALPPDELEENDKYKARWKHVHLLANEFWRRWVKEYLPTLQERQKWLVQKPNFKIGDLVLVADKNTSRGEWPKALIEETFPDADNVVRRVILRTANGVYQRDVRKICLLEEELLKRFENNVGTKADKV